MAEGGLEGSLEPPVFAEELLENGLRDDGGCCLSAGRTGWKGRSFLAGWTGAWADGPAADPVRPASADEGGTLVAVGPAADFLAAPRMGGTRFYYGGGFKDWVWNGNCIASSKWLPVKSFAGEKEWRLVVNALFRKKESYWWMRGKLPICTLFWKYPLRSMLTRWWIFHYKVDTWTINTDKTTETHRSNERCGY